jgi:hypothetical protein
MRNDAITKEKNKVKSHQSTQAPIIASLPLQS